MPASKVGVPEFREQIASFLESAPHVTVARRSETPDIYVPTSRTSVKSADVSELRAAAERLATTLSDVDEEEIVAEFKSMVSRSPSPTRNTESDDAGEGA